MRELERLLKYRDLDFKFNHLKSRVRCFPHIINICVSHIIASSTQVSKEYINSLRSEGDDDFLSSNIENNDDNDNDNDNDDDDDDDNDDDDNDDDDNDDDDDDDDSHYNKANPWRIRRHIPKLKLKNFELDGLSTEELAWFSGMKCDPVKRARTIVRILRSSDQRKRDFKEVIKNGNKSEWFRGVDSVVMVPDLEPLRDVKTRWDSTYAIVTNTNFFLTHDQPILASGQMTRRQLTNDSQL